MPVTKEARVAFNRGLISRLGLARKDVERVALSAQTMTNWMPRVLGSMSLRPGLEYIGLAGSNNNFIYTKFIPFVFSLLDKALLQLTQNVLRVWLNDVPISLSSQAITITNPYFAANVTNWTDADEAGATSDWVTDGGGDGYLRLVGTGYKRAIRYQSITTASPTLEHSIKILIERGPVNFRIGTALGLDDVLPVTGLGTGQHILTFIPTVSPFFIQFESRLKRQILVDSCEAFDGELSLTGNGEAPFPLTESGSIRWAQSADVLYLACNTTDYSYSVDAPNGSRPMKIERRATKSWSFVEYQPEDGPFRVENLSNIFLTPSAISGNITLTASEPMFRALQVGSLFSIDSIGQTVNQVLNGANQFSGYVRVTGVDASRQFTVALSGTWSATITLQRSVGEPGVWVDVVSYTGNTTSVYDDGLDNQTMYYRIGIKAGAYTSGTAAAILEFSGGTIMGVVRITDYTSSTVVGAEVLTELGSTEASEIWSEGIWSDYRGWPTAVALFEGRLWWAGRNYIIGSISDAYEAFDINFEGDAGPIIRTIGQGPVDTINWILPLQRLLMGTASAEWSAKSTTFDEPLTATVFSLKTISTQGSAKVGAVELDSGGLFVQRAGTKLYQLAFDNTQNIYNSNDLMAIVPELGDVGIRRVVIQRQPDTRIHCVLNDGTVAVLIYDKTEDVKGWVKVETTGNLNPDEVVFLGVYDACILPGTEEDEVYYVVARNASGDQAIVYLEKFSLASECVGGLLNKQLDSFVTKSAANAVTFINTHYSNGQEVSVWADGAYRGTQVLDNGPPGVLYFPVTYSDVVVGLPYTATFRSSKIGDDLSIAKRIVGFNLVLADTHYQGLQYGNDLNHLDELPLLTEGVETPADTIWDEYHHDTITVNGIADEDSRLCLVATGPLPVTVLAAVVEYEPS